MPQRRTKNRQATPKRAKITPPLSLTASSPEQVSPCPSAGPQTTSVLAVAPAKVTFRVYEPHARRVSLAGEFNQWDPIAAPMQSHDDGHWSITLDLPPGRYQYKFVVDGQWLPDLTAHENVPNEHGTLNSVIEVHTSSQNS